jgi:ubiquinone/menaquinone biosynthesis C-methylase UbiE
MGFYDRRILPPLLDLALQTKMMRGLRERIVPRAEGRVLEVGVGSGLNFPFYDGAKVREIVGLDPSAELRRYAERRAKSVTVPVSFIGLEAEKIPLDDHSVDTVLMTFTLCSIDNVAAALSGMRRVLKPGGRLLFCEHGLAPDARVQRWQNRLTPLWKWIAGGCHLNRPIAAMIDHAGFALETFEASYMPGAPRFAGFVTLGSARPN